MKKFLTIFGVLFVFGVVFSSVLLLYKGSEEGYGYNVLRSYVVPVIEKAGKDYRIVDIEKEDIDFSEYELVVSCYYTPTMKGAKKYLRKLANYLATGGKLLIINNLGAFSDEGDDQPSLNEINAVFNLLGVSYSYGWRKLFVISYEVDEEFKKLSPPHDVKRDFENYEIFSPTVEVILKAITPKGAIPVGFYGRRGGVLLYNHPFDENGNIYINLSKLIKKIFTNTWDGNTVLLLTDSHDALMTFKNALFDVKKEVEGTLSVFKAVVTKDGNILKEKNFLNYVRNGGVVIIIGKGEKTAKGRVVFKKLGLLPEDLISPDILEVHYINAPEGSFPFITVGDKTVGWIKKFGRGAYLFFPEELLNRTTRGFLFNAFLYASDFVISPIVNSFSVFLDDFPLPAYAHKYERITREFGDVTDGEFYYEIWWNDVKEISRKFGLKLTAALVTNYGTNMDFFNFTEFLQTPYPSNILVELLNLENVEIAVHGYNHISPLKSLWKESDLVKSFIALKSFMENFTESFLPITYIAPNNLIDDMGVRAVKKVFPSVKLIGTTYGSEETLNEFGILEETVILPRTTAGYYPIEKLLYDSISAVINFGTFQYFIHPDDLIDKYRNPEGWTWNRMKESMKEFLMKIKSFYPWLENDFGYEAAIKFEDYFKKRPDVNYKDGCVYVTFPKSTLKKRYFYLSSNSSVIIKGGKIIYKYEKIYVIETSSHKISVCKGNR